MDNNVKTKETLTFYRRMANTNHIIMKKYKSAAVNRMKYDEIKNIYNENNIEFKDDIERLKLFMQKKVVQECPSDPNNITSETDSEQNNSEPNNNTYDTDSEQNNTKPKNFILETYNNNIELLKKDEFLTKTFYLPVIIPVLLTCFIAYGRYCRSKK